MRGSPDLTLRYSDSSSALMLSIFFSNSSISDTIAQYPQRNVREAHTGREITLPERFPAAAAACGMPLRFPEQARKLQAYFTVSGFIEFCHDILYYKAMYGEAVNDLDIAPTLERLINELGPGKARAGEPMAAHTTFRVGGPADIFIEPESIGDVAAAMRICREAAVPLLVMGNGSNLLVRDGGIRGAVLHIGSKLGSVDVDGTTVRAQAGALLSRVAAEAMRSGLAGLEFASGIPGSVGGAAAMNAGAYGGEMRDAVRRVTAIAPSGEILRLSNAKMAYSYRHSRALEEGLVVVEVELSLRRGDMAASRALAEEYAASRREKQPLELPSAGSFFKRPPGHFAGKLISDAGLRGCSVGGAMVSEKHAGFIVNAGGATAADILALAGRVRERVLELFGVELTPEVRVVGEDAEWRRNGG